jgi:hypothetical protein
VEQQSSEQPRRQRRTKRAAHRACGVAEADLLSIGAYTLRTWGEDQTIRYIDGRRACRVWFPGYCTSACCPNDRPANRISLIVNEKVEKSVILR